MAMSPCRWLQPRGSCALVCFAVATSAPAALGATDSCSGHCECRRCPSIAVCDRFDTLFDPPGRRPQYEDGRCMCAPGSCIHENEFGTYCAPAPWQHDVRCSVSDLDQVCRCVEGATTHAGPPTTTSTSSPPASSTTRPSLPTTVSTASEPRTMSPTEPPTASNRPGAPVCNAEPVGSCLLFCAFHGQARCIHDRGAHGFHKFRGKCICREGYCADPVRGVCVPHDSLGEPDPACSKKSVGRCGLFCALHGAASCLDGECICNEGFCADDADRYCVSRSFATNRTALSAVGPSSQKVSPSAVAATALAGIGCAAIGATAALAWRRKRGLAAEEPLLGS